MLGLKLIHVSKRGHRASVATVLNLYQCISSCLWLMDFLSKWYENLLKQKIWVLDCVCPYIKKSYNSAMDNQISLKHYSFSPKYLRKIIETLTPWLAHEDKVVSVLYQSMWFYMWYCVTINYVIMRALCTLYDYTHHSVELIYKVLWTQIYFSLVLFQFGLKSWNSEILCVWFSVKVTRCHKVIYNIFRFTHYGWWHYISLCLYKLTHWGRDKMDAILQTTFSSAFSWMKMFEFRLKFHWSLFLRLQLTIFHHWFR